MHQHGIRAVMTRRVRTTDSRHDLPIAPNLIARDFTAAAPTRVWLADITYIQPRLYLAAIMDLFGRKIVGWAMRDHKQVELACAALMMAIQQQRPQPGLIHHSHRGVQYASRAYRNALSGAGITASMSRKADCYDNAPDGELLPYLEDRARSPSKLQDARRGRARYLRLHRGLLQPNKASLRRGIYRPDRDGAKSRLTCLLFRGKVSGSPQTAQAVGGDLEVPPIAAVHETKFPIRTAFGWGPPMELFWAEKLVAVEEDQSSKICRACAEKLSLVRVMVDSETGGVIHMFECRCGERVWSD
jgi:putative transposase